MGLYDRRVALGSARMGDVATDIANKIVVAFTPQLKELTASAAEAAQPVISKIVREDLVPAAAPWVVVGFIALGATAAIIGALLARTCKRCTA